MGRYVVCTCRGTVMWDENNTPEYFVGCIRNHGLVNNLDSLTGFQNRKEISEKMEIDGYHSSLQVNGSALEVNMFDVNPQAMFSCLGYAYNISKEKENGDFHIFRDEIDEQRHNLLELINSIRKSIEDGCRGFVLFYQPIVDARTHVLRGSEALLRWEDPEYGLVPPNKFISIIEKQGIHLKISAWRLPRGAVR